MDCSPIINEVFKLWWLILIQLVVSIFKTPWFKDVLVETLVKLAAEMVKLGQFSVGVDNYVLRRPTEGQWQSVKIPVSQLVEDGLKLEQVSAPLRLKFTGLEQSRLTVGLKNIRWQYAPE